MRVFEWVPCWDKIVVDLTYIPSSENDDSRHLAAEGEFDYFDGYFWTRFTAQHWEVPLVAVALYVVLLVVGQRMMKNRDEVKIPLTLIWWNLSLSIFSFAGAYSTIPKFLYHNDIGVLSHKGGFYASVCAHPVIWGAGHSGLFVFLFIYSKLFELVDTVILVLRKRPVGLLHWYHHITVLLYCWHSYAVRIGTGQWFACMNYFVHSLMYLYYCLTQCGAKWKGMVKPVAPLLTSLQLLQMVVGIVVTVASIIYTQEGKQCYVNRTNSLLGLTMYSSYFVLFAQLFLNAYVYKTVRAKQAKSTKKD